MNKIRIKKAYKERKEALLWALVWLGAVVGLTGVGLINDFRYNLGEVHLNNAFMLMVIFFAISYISYRRGEL